VLPIQIPSYTGFGYPPESKFVDTEEIVSKYGTASDKSRALGSRSILSAKKISLNQKSGVLDSIF
jgi:hypothetical protein